MGLKMKNNCQYKKSKGFTLIEILILIGAITIVIIAIYLNFSRKAAQQTALTQSIYLEQLSSGINNIFASSNNLAVLTPTNVISSRSVPEQMVKDPNTITNLFGGTIQFSNLGTTPPSYGIILSQVPRVSCGFLVTTGYSNLADSIIVNTTTLKAPGSVATSALVGAAAAACDNNFNTVEFRKIIERANDLAVLTATPIRGKEDPNYIPSIASNISGPVPSCSGGSSWNGSFCGCPVSKQWNGSNCVVFPSGPPPSIVYSGGRYVPNLGYAGGVQQTPAEIGNACTAAGGNFNGTYCDKCANGTWNGTKCVTP